MFKNLFSTLSKVFKTKEVRDKIFYSFLVIVIFRFLAAVPVVGITVEAIEEMLSQAGGSDAVSILSAGALETASVIAIGIGPYISASIVIQLMGSIIPKLEELRKDGSQGQRVLNMYTRYLTVPLAIMQSFVIYGTLRGLPLENAVPDLSVMQLTGMIATLTGGAMLLMWIAELVGEEGLANGSSYLIFLGILSGIIGRIITNLRYADGLEIGVFAISILILVAAVVYITEAERRIKLMYSRRMNTAGAQENYIPMKITQFGVMPVIFASALLTFPIYIAQFIAARDISDQVTQYSTSVFELFNNLWVQNLGTFFMVIIFSFFYITVVFNPVELAENLQKQGAFIRGIRPGKQTENYLRGVAYRLTAFGGLFLAILAVLPTLLVQWGLVSTTVMSGTGLLIVVGVVLDIRRKVQSMIVVRSYDKYI